MKTLIVIPARMASSRFPGKPMKKILGTPMIGHVYNRSKRSKLLNDAVSNAAFQAILNQIFPASMFVYMNDDNGILDAGIWRIDLTIS